jgi:hypothetical protein
MGSDEDPKDGGAVAGAVFGAVFIYIVRSESTRKPEGADVLTIMQGFFVFCGFQAFLHLRESRHVKIRGILRWGACTVADVVSILPEVEASSARGSRESHVCRALGVLRVRLNIHYLCTIEYSAVYAGFGHTISA